MTDTDVPVVYIRWLDHFSLVDQWMSWEAMKASDVSLEIKTVGFLVDEGDGFYRVAYNISDSATISGCITILKPTVLEYKELHVNDRVGKRKKTD